MLEPSEGKSVASFADTVFTCTIILLMSTLCFSPMESSYCKKEKNILVREKYSFMFSLYVWDNTSFFQSWEKTNAELFSKEIKLNPPCYYSSENSDWNRGACVTQQ